MLVSGQAPFDVLIVSQPHRSEVERRGRSIGARARLPRTRYEGPVNTIVQSHNCRLFDVITTLTLIQLIGASRDCRTTKADLPRLECAVRAISWSLRERRNLAMKDVRLGNWLPLLIALTAAVDGWLMLGLLAQATLTATAVIRRLRGTTSKAPGRTNDSP